MKRTENKQIATRCNKKKVNTHLAKKCAVLNNQFRILKKIGEGLTCKVYLASVIQDNVTVNNQELRDHKYVAIKIFNDVHLQDHNQTLTNEVKIMESLDHENCMKLLGHGDNGQMIRQDGCCIVGVKYLVLEYIQGALMFDIVKTCRGLGENNVRPIFGQMIDALSHLKQNRIAHLDIKLENLMINNEKQVKFLDFGLSKQGDIDNLNGFQGTRSYCAPEIREMKTYKGELCDVFSSGVVLFSLVTGIFPFIEANDSDKYFNLLINNRYDQYWETINRHQGHCLSEDFKELIEGMLAYDPAERLSIDQIIESRWVQNNKDETRVSDQSNTDYKKEFQPAKQSSFGNNFNRQVSSAAC